MESNKIFKKNSTQPERLCLCDPLHEACPARAPAFTKPNRLDGEACGDRDFEVQRFDLEISRRRGRGVEGALALRLAAVGFHDRIRRQEFFIGCGQMTEGVGVGMLGSQQGKRGNRWPLTFWSAQKIFDDCGFWGRWEHELIRRVFFRIRKFPF
jgi:hypothetical protein